MKTILNMINGKATHGVDVDLGELVQLETIRDRTMIYISTESESNGSHSYY